METSSIAHRSEKKERGYLFEFIKKKVIDYLNHLEYGVVVIEDGSQSYRYEGNTECGRVAVIKVQSPEFYTSVFFRGSMGAAEAYMKGYWDTPNLLKVTQIFSANLKLLGSLRMNRFLPLGSLEKCLHLINNNTKEGSKKNISHHYDLSNEFFKQFLDETMMYSAGVFDMPEDTMWQASVNKLDIICQKLDLKPSDHLLEIGTGWGGLAIHAAKQYGCKVTTTTISKKQYEYASDLVKALGLEDSVTLLLKDYRDLDGQYDKLVSVEMIEAVGYQHYQSYFSQCNRLLKSGGLMMLQAITIPGQRYEQAKKSVDFIQKYIFPGGCLPSIQVISESVSQYTDLQMVHLNDITLHYADTLAEWRKRFNLNIDKIKALGFDEPFCRMWHYYLCYCEGGFRERIINTHHIILHKSIQ